MKILTLATLFIMYINTLVAQDNPYPYNMYLDVNIGLSTYEKGKFIAAADLGILYEHAALEANISTVMETRFGACAGILFGYKPFTHYVYGGFSRGYSNREVPDGVDAVYTKTETYYTTKPVIGYKWSWGAGDMNVRYIHQTAIQLTVGVQIREIINRIVNDKY